MSWNVKYVVLIIFTTVISYIAALFISKTNDKKKKKVILILSLFSSMSVLFVFKYLNFFFESISSFANLFTINLHPVTLKLLLPVGISFYTFQTISYVIDVFRGKVEAESNIGIYATFVSFFPQLVAGPIERTSSLLPQIKKEHKFDYNKAICGAEFMIWGYFKKLVIADNIAGYVDDVYANLQNYKGFDLLLVIFLFTIQIYCDFSGYSDIAIGTAKLLDIDLMLNFRSPYLSYSIREFWSRWHISLTTWFRDYVYIPLGGNRVGRVRHYLNIMITFLLSGLWHGANWTFVLWGGIHGIAEIVELTIFGRKAQGGKIICIIRTIIVFVFCNIAWVFFRADSLRDIFYIFSNVFSNFTRPSLFFTSDLLESKELIFILIPVCLLGVYDYIDKVCGFQTWVKKKSSFLTWLVYVFFGLMIIFCSRKGVAADFVYFQF